MKENKIPPPLVVQNNQVIGIGSFGDRKPAYENIICEAAGLIATCNCCDRIIFEDENWMDEYSTNGGYCKECSEENKAS